MKFMKEIVSYQMSNEKKENAKIRDYLAKAFQLADDFQN